MDQATRSRNFRARRDSDPERRKRYLEYGREKYKLDLLSGKKTHINNRPEEEQELQREKWRENKQQQKIKKALGYVDSALPLPSTSKGKGTERSYQAMKQKLYRDRKKANDPTFLQREADRAKKYFKPVIAMDKDELERDREKRRIYVRRCRLKKKLLESAESDGRNICSLELDVDEDVDYTTMLNSPLTIQNTLDESKVFPVALGRYNDQLCYSQTVQVIQNSNMYISESETPGCSSCFNNEDMDKTTLHKQLGLNDTDSGANKSIGYKKIRKTPISVKKKVQRSSRFKPFPYKRKNCHRQGYVLFKLCRKILRKYIILEGLRVQVPAELFDEMFENI